MIKNNASLSQVKELILKLKEKPVKVTFSLGRNRFVSFNGKLKGVYPALFTIAPFDKTFNGKTSYSYSEYMCGRVKLIEMDELESQQL